MTFLRCQSATRSLNLHHHILVASCCPRYLDHFAIRLVLHSSIKSKDVGAATFRTVGTRGDFVSLADTSYQQIPDHPGQRVLRLGRDELLGFRYWGGIQGDFQNELTAQGYTVYTAAVGPFASNWDRACELYAIIKGGQYGRPDRPNARSTAGHGTTGAPIGEDPSSHTLFKGGKSWVHSITTISTPNQGTTLGNGFSTIGDSVKDLLAGVLSVVGILGDSAKMVYDAKLDQWGITTKQSGESIQAYLDRVFSSRIFDPSFKDVCLWSLSTGGAKEEATWVKTLSDVYYYSYTTVDTFDTRDLLLRKISLPNLLTMLLPLDPLAVFLGGRYAPDKLKLSTDWQPNDGVVNTFSMGSDGVGAAVTFAGASQLGKWNKMPLLNRLDHLAVVGITLHTQVLDLTMSLFFSVALLLLSAVVSHATNTYPVVLVHGFGGWGRDELLGFKYWGGIQGDIQEELEALGYTVYTASIGPFSSNWDRACELYAQIKGGVTDYGLLTQPTTITCASAKTTRVCHSMGGQTIRMLAQMLEKGTTGAPVEETTYTSPLFEGGHDWIHSITTISTPNQGTTLADGFSEIGDTIKDLLVSIINVLGIFGDSVDLLYDAQLDQWGITAKQDDETLQEYFDRAFSSSIFDSSFKDVSIWSLSVAGAKEESMWVETLDDVYYYSYATKDTFSTLRPLGCDRYHPALPDLWHLRGSCRAALQSAGGLSSSRRLVVANSTVATNLDSAISSLTTAAASIQTQEDLEALCEDPINTYAENYCANMLNATLVNDTIATANATVEAATNTSINTDVSSTRMLRG
ncbi:Alpha/Beta hydrolase fold [Phytophthora cactorum]|nr:Alpha/Beta hydrolase fold [Phytophthora cactorum]